MTTSYGSEKTSSVSESGSSSTSDGSSYSGSTSYDSTGSTSDSGSGTPPANPCPAPPAPIEALLSVSDLSGVATIGGNMIIPLPEGFRSDCFGASATLLAGAIIRHYLTISTFTAGNGQCGSTSYTLPNDAPLGAVDIVGDQVWIPWQLSKEPACATDYLFCAGYVRIEWYALDKP